MLRCKLTIPISCSSNSTSCELQVWLNHKNLKSTNRIVVKQCNKNADGVFNCNGCNQKISSNGNGEIFWNIVSNMESSDLKRANEIYDVDLLSNKDSTSLGSLWKNLKLPSLKVSQINTQVFK